METPSDPSASSASQSNVQQHDKTSLSRRSVDWRDSGIVIDEEQHQFQFYSFEASSENQPFAHVSDTSISNNTPQATTRCPVQRSVFEPDDDGDTILHLAVVSCASHEVQDLIKMCDLNAINNMMQTPFHVAVLANRPDIVNILIKSGAKLDVHDRQGNTPLHLACQKGHKLILETILSSNADEPLHVNNLEQLLEITNFNGHTCLHLAFLEDRREIIEILVNKYGANVNCQDGKSGETILHKAINKFDVDLVSFILNLGKHCNEADFSGRDPSDLIRELNDSRLSQNDKNKLQTIGKLVSDKFKDCIQRSGCCLNSKHNLETKGQILNSSETSSNSSDLDTSDYE